MPKYRKKPVIIEAVQWFKDGDHPQVRRCEVNEFHEQTNGRTNIKGFGWDAHGICGTLEGKHVVTPGDYVITGVQGEIYPCKSDIFEATYEKIE